MSDIYVLYNPLAGKGGKTVEERLKKHMPEVCPIMRDITKVEEYSEFFGSISFEDKVIICGGDGTINRFVNDTSGLSFPCDIMYFAAGSGNDFLKDLEKDADAAPFSILEYIKDLPMVTVNGESRRFINGVGLGLDGFCCAEVARAKGKGKSTTYIAVAIKAFLKTFTPANAKVTVDGESFEYKKVWLAPTMKGRYFGGGVLAAPMRSRTDDNVTLLLMHDASRLAALVRFPTFMKGNHPK